MPSPDAVDVEHDRRVSELLGHNNALLERARTAERECRRLEARCNNVVRWVSTENDEICQLLGKALGYPWYKDDQKNFPGATEEDGVCVGDNVAITLAMQAAKKIEFFTDED